MPALSKKIVYTVITLVLVAVALGQTLILFFTDEEGSQHAQELAEL